VAGRLEGKVAIVTGAGAAGPGWGNGKATAVRFAQEGAQVFAVDRSTEAVAETAQLVRAEGAECVAHTADVSEDGEVAAFVDRCVATWGQIDILHNNVGILAPGGPVEVTDADWERVMKVNVTAALYCCRHVIPHMAARHAGSIINVSSVASNRQLGVSYVAYPASKAALNGFTRAIAVQHGPDGIRCNALLPGIIRTPMLEQQVMGALGAPDDPEAFAAYCARREAVIPLRCLGDPWDVANAALFLASDESRYVTGIELVVDGGISQTVGFES